MDMKIFATRKAQELFLEMSNALTGKKKAQFSEEVKALFDEKVTSEDGEYAEFKVTEKDLFTIAESYK